MAARISPTWWRLRPAERLLAAAAALVIGGLALTACTAAPSTPAAAGAHDRPAAASAVGVAVTDDVPYAGTTNRQQDLDVCEPTPNGTTHPAVLLIHGGGWKSGDATTVMAQCLWLAQAGFVTFDVDYRLSPGVRFPAEPDDVAAALAFMRRPATVSRYEITPDRVAVFGGSAGGNLAAQLAFNGTSRLDALVDLSGPVELTGPLLRYQSAALTKDETGYLGCRTLSRCPAAKAASPLFRVRPGDPPTFIGQASVDFVPHQQGDALAAALTRAHVPVTVEQTPGTHHSFGALTPKMKTDIVTFLRTNLAS